MWLLFDIWNPTMFCHPTCSHQPVPHFLPIEILAAKPARPAIEPQTRLQTAGRHPSPQQKRRCHVLVPKCQDSPKQDLQGPEIHRNPQCSAAHQDHQASTVLHVRGIGMVSGVRPWVFRKDCNWSWKYCVIFGGQLLAKSGMNHTHLPAPHGSWSMGISWNLWGWSKCGGHSKTWKGTVFVFWLAISIYCSHSGHNFANVGRSGKIQYTSSSLEVRGALICLACSSILDNTDGQ